MGLRIVKLNMTNRYTHSTLDNNFSSACLFIPWEGRGRELGGQVGGKNKFKVSYKLPKETLSKMGKRGRKRQSFKNVDVWETEAGG